MHNCIGSTRQDPQSRSSTISQGLKMESHASIVNANSTTAKVTNPSEQSLQKMSQDNENGWMEVEDSMIFAPGKSCKGI